MANTTPKPFVFVLMPFSQKFEDVYKLGIGPACKEVGAYCERVDEQIFTESIVERIYNQIAKADIVVSDMTDQNPNVFYETGYAHALGKSTILLTQKADDIPFDLKHAPHIVYGNSVAGLKRERNLGWIITIGIRNKGGDTIDVTDIHFGFVWPTLLGDPVLGFGSYSRINEAMYMIDISDQFLSLFPEAWIHKPVQIMNREIHETYDSFSLTVKQRRQGNPNNARLMAQTAHLCSIRTFTAFGMREFPFTIWVN